MVVRPLTNCIVACNLKKNANFLNDLLVTAKYYYSCNNYFFN